LVESDGTVADRKPDGRPAALLSFAYGEVTDARVLEFKAEDSLHADVLALQLRHTFEGLVD
jgi:hypothetical protein